MQVDLDFLNNKTKMTDTVMAVYYITAVDSVKSEQGIGQFLGDEQLKITQTTEAEITKIHQNFQCKVERQARRKARSQGKKTARIQASIRVI
jgi:hypothetical protein